MQRKRRWLWILMAAVSVTGLALAGAVIYAGATMFDTRRPAPTAPELEKWIGVKVPAGATGYQSYVEGFQDWMLLARFELPSSELAPFLAANRLEPAPDKTSAPTAETQAWFRPSQRAQAHAPTRLPDGHADAPAGPDPADLTTVWTEPVGDRVIVHLYSFTY
jgi:hypothetical protein